MSHQDDKLEGYDPEQIGSTDDGTDTKSHDCTVLRAPESEYTPNCAPYGDMRNTVVVGRLHPTITQKTLTSEFSDCGKIINCRILKDVTDDFELYYAFIQFEQSSSVNKALSKYRDYIRDNTEVVDNVENERGAESQGG